MKLSKLTLYLGAYIIISASFIQQVWKFARAALGTNTVSLFLILLFLLAAASAIYKSTKAAFNIKRIILTLVICASAFIFSARQPYMTEKAHVLEYGLLGWLAIRDFSNNKILKGVFLTFAFVLLVSCLDEGFQKLLPWRVFEVRDILTNLVSGALGILLFIAK